MNAKDLRIIFLGTPDFAVASLKALIEAGFNVVAVVTAPDKPAGRGMKMQQSAVKQFALQHNLKVLQPERLREEAFLEQLQSLNADLQLVVAFRMLPKAVWNMPPLGTINLHGSLLPDYRGAAPINWAIINGEKETGVTTFQLKQQIDTGNILLQEKIPILPNDNMGTLHDTMKITGANLLVKTVQRIADNSLKAVEQPKEESKPAPKIFKENCLINFEKTIQEVNNLIRGLSPFPAAYTYLDGKILKIFSAETEMMETSETPGTYTTDKKSFLKFACANGYIHALEVQLEGKRKMQIADFLRGHRFD